MSAPTVLAAISDQSLDLAAHEAAVEHPMAGARVSFCGVVRNHDGGRDVVELEYVAHPSAQQVIEDIAARFRARPDVLAVAISHRIGTLRVGDIALAAAVSTAHRRLAFETCAELVDEVKAALPIWKRQTFTDGTDEWVNFP